ncbi:F0F1 ATP synthase subunit delta [Candidatus Daviesbacteria bacterium]|nr:F0F1 ATP synthase subunit delta [Candidatus Daviesbacteria bacterium]
MNNEILNSILANTYTMHDLHHRLRILKTSLEAKFFGMKLSPLPPDDENWLNSLPVQFLGQFNKDNFYAIFEELEKKIDQISPLVIYLSFEPTPEILQQINLWFRTNLNTRFIFETKLDPSLVGGVALVLNGVYQDFSLRARIQEQKELILTEFKKYVSQ